MRSTWKRSFLAASALACILSHSVSAQTVSHVIHISVDGMRPDAVAALGPLHCPNLHMLMVEGTYTLNARTDCDYTNTLPNHACQMTGRAVLGPGGHGVSFNSDTGGTIADAHGSYVAGIFDVVHDNGLSTALFSGKEKFDLFDRSWDAVNGGTDVTGEDNGRDKIDTYMYSGNTTELVDSFLLLLDSTDPGYFFLHLRDPDTDGHAYGWKSTEYLDSIKRMDAAIGRVLDAAPVNTAVIVTADHGGTGTSHDNASDPFNYTIQLHAWGPGIPAGADIYMMNPGTRLDPGATQPPCGAPLPPVRNGEAANLAAAMLGLDPVPGSTIGYAQGLAVTAPGTLPDITITSPPDASGYGPDDTVLIEVDAWSSTGILKVEFFADWIKIGETDMPPYQLDWEEIPLGTHEVVARAVDLDGYAETDMIRVTINSPTAAETADLGKWDRPRVYPNPAGASSQLFMHLDSPRPVEIFFFDAAGRLAGRHRTATLSTGSQIIDLDMGNYPSGIYFFRTVAGSDVRSGKFVLIR